MKKLTIEQRDWLTAYFLEKATKDSKFLQQFTKLDIGEPHFNLRAIAHVLNECTEVEDAV